MFKYILAIGNDNTFYLVCQHINRENDANLFFVFSFQRNR